jgi:hypothetical protein
MDELIFKETLANSNLLRQFIDNGQRLIPEFDAISMDLYLILYKIVIKLNSEDSLSLHHVIIESLATHPRTANLRLRCAGSKGESYLAMKLLLDQLLEKLRGTDFLDDMEEQIEAYNNLLSLTKSDDSDDFDFTKLLNPREIEMIDEISSRLDSSNVEPKSFITTLLQLLNKHEGADKGMTRQGDGPEKIMPTIPSKTEDKSPLTDYIEKVKEHLDQPESSTTVENALEEVLRKEGEVDSDYDEYIKDDLESRFKPFIKSFSIGEAHGASPFHRQMDTIDDNEHVDQNKIIEGMATPKGLPIETQMMKLTPELRKELEDKRDEIRKKTESLDWDDMIVSTNEKLDHFNDQIKTLGIPGRTLSDLTFDEILSLYNRTKSARFIEFINKVGKNKKHASAIAYKKKREKITPQDGIRYSSDIDGLIEDEFIGIALDIEAFENDFYDRYLNDNLLTIEMAEKKDKRKGPIILCYDGSGSMQGKKFDETLAHILAILEISKIQKRKLVLIQFASASEPLYMKQINPLSVTAGDVLDILDTFICGGTDFEKPLSTAMEIIKQAKHKNSDILFITDGQCEIHPTFQEKFLTLKRERKFKLYTIIMHSYTYKDYGDIGLISDEILDIRGDNLGNWNTLTNQRLYTLI